MRRWRIPFCFVLALTFVALTCDVSGACALATVEASCPCMISNDAPGADLSGGQDAPGLAVAGKPESTHERLTFAVHGDACLRASAELPLSLSVRVESDDVGFRSAPLYLTHCSFLC